MKLADRFLDWLALREIVTRHGLPDIPEVRTFARACWMNGFTHGQNETEVARTKADAVAAVERAERLA